MQKALPTWSVVATVDEPAGLVQAYVAWHLALGARSVHLYFDRPDDPAADLFAHLDAVYVTRCDATHWQRLGRSRPVRHEVRQVQNARDAYAISGADWLLHSDADEFLWCAGPVAEALAAVPPASDCAAAFTAERVMRAGVTPAHVLEGPFRLPFQGKPDAARAPFGPACDLTYRGLTGHAHGKAFARVGQGLRLSIHRPKPVDPDQKVVVHKMPTDQMMLLHFEGLTRQQWVFKLMRMAKALAEADGMPPTPHRAQQAAALLADPDGAGALHDRLKVLDEAALARLAAHDLVRDVPFSVAKALQRYFPDTRVDLRPEAIDAWLAAQKGGTLAYLQGQRA